MTRVVKRTDTFLGSLRLKPFVKIKRPLLTVIKNQTTVGRPVICWWLTVR